MLFAHAAPRARLLLVALTILPLAAVSAQTPAASSAGGLPLPDLKEAASMEAALAVLDRSSGTVVAEVGSATVTWGDVADSIRSMPPIVGSVPFQQLYQRAAAQVMQVQALALLATQSGLDKDPIVQRRLKNAADQALAGEYMRRSLAPNITDKALRAVYDGAVAGKPGPEEVDARIIMVDSEDEATALIQRLQKGADFPQLARESSKDGTAENDGELGYARLDMLAPEIGSVVFALAPGQMTAFPVRSGNSWFILKVESRRQPPPPSFEVARTPLEQDVIHAGVPELRRMALQAVAIRYYGLAGKKQPVETPK